MGGEPEVGGDGDKGDWRCDVSDFRWGEFYCTCGRLMDAYRSAQTEIHVDGRRFDTGIYACLRCRLYEERTLESNWRRRAGGMADG
jgi:hypothetical protein